MENIAIVGQTAISIEEVKEAISTAPQVLVDNRNSVVKAKAIGEVLLSQVEKDGMSEVLDGEMSSYLAKIKNTVKSMNEKRKPFSQLVTKLIKEFTTLESSMDETAEKIQGHRNTYAAKKLAEENERRRVALLNQNRDAEKIEAKKQIELQLSELFTAYLTEKKIGIQQMFDSYTLETVKNADIELGAISLSCESAYDNFTLKLSFAPKFITETEVATIKTLSLKDKRESYYNQFETSVKSEQRRLVDMIPSKKNQLQEAFNLAEIARLKKIEEDKAAEELRLANEAAAKLEGEEKEKKKLEAKTLADSLQKIQDEQNAALLEKERVANEEKERQEKEAKRISAESTTMLNENKAEINVTAVAESATAIVQSQGRISFGAKSKTKIAYQIEISDISAYLILAQFWFEKEGVNMSADKLELVTFDRIKRFCEKWATDKEEKITSDLITYTDKVTAK